MTFYVAQFHLGIIHMSFEYIFLPANCPFFDLDKGEKRVILPCVSIFAKICKYSQLCLSRICWD